MKAYDMVKDELPKDGRLRWAKRIDSIYEKPSNGYCLVGEWVSRRSGIEVGEDEIYVFTYYQGEGREKDDLMVQAVRMLRDMSGGLVSSCVFIGQYYEDFDKLKEAVEGFRVLMPGKAPTRKRTTAKGGAIGAPRSWSHLSIDTVPTAEMLMELIKRGVLGADGMIHMAELGGSKAA